MKTEIPNETRYTHDFPSHYRKVITELERENAALKEAFAKAELLSDPAVAEGHYEYVEVWGYFRPNEIAVVIDRAAFNAARSKEAKP